MIKRFETRRYRGGFLLLVVVDGVLKRKFWGGRSLGDGGLRTGMVV